MKTGRSIQSLAQELVRIQQSKRDFIAPVSSLRFLDDGHVTLDDVGSNTFDINDWARRQIAEWSGVPFAYSNALRAQNPALLAKCLNHSVQWSLKAAPADRRLIRTLDGSTRAFLSSRYRILDSSDLLETAMPVIVEHGLRVESAEITEQRLYVKAFSDKLTAEVRVGDAVQYGIVISSSDVGAGSVRVEPMIYRLACLNGMVIADSRVRKFHIGRNIEAESVRELFSDETKVAADRAFWMGVRDVVVGSLKAEVFQAAVDRLRVAAGELIKNPDLARVVELTSKAVGITGEDVRQSILQNLADGKDFTRWGLSNAVTAAANNSDNYEVACELERAGGRVIEIGAHEWKTISAA